MCAGADIRTFHRREIDMNRFAVVSIWSFLVALALWSCALEQSDEQEQASTPALPLPSSSPTPLRTQSPLPDDNEAPVNARAAPIVRVGPRDLIPAVFDPVHISIDEVDDQAGPFSTVIGVSIAGESAAYSVDYLSSREVVNDTVGGEPILVTW